MDKDQPDLYEIERMIKFCKKYKYIFILGDNDGQKYLAKFLDSINIKYMGFISYGEKKTPKSYTVKEAFNLVKHFYIGDFNITNLYNVGVIVMDFLNPYYLQKEGFKNFFFLSDQNKRNIPLKMRPLEYRKLGIEYNLVDHCNLNCKSCDHCAPIADEFYISKEEFESDIKRLSEVTCDKLEYLVLMGGEALLHPELIELLKIARKYFKESPVNLHSNGILVLNKENLFETLKELNITLIITTYPINVNYEAIDKKAKETGISYYRMVYIGDGSYKGKKWLTHTPWLLKKNAPDYYYISCYHFNECITLRHGKIYTCPFKPYSEHFSKYFKKELKITQDDYIDIYKINSFEEIAEFCTKRTPFCSHCDIKNRTKFDFEISKKAIEEWT